MSITKHEVKPVTIAGVKGYQVQALYRDCSDSFWEPIAHAAVFRTPERAQRMLERIKRTGSWQYNWAYWGAPVGSYTSSSCAIQTSVAPFSPL